MSTAPTVLDLARQISAACARALGQDGELADLRRLSGGANMETWSFDWHGSSAVQPLILRRRPEMVDHSAVLPGVTGIGLDTEAALINLARRHRVPVATPRGELVPEDALGEGYFMSRLQGEALPQRLLREDRYGVARERFAFSCGEALASIHAIPLEDCPPGLRDLSWRDDLLRLQGLLDQYGNVSPVHQLALNWLREQPSPASPRVLCHGDFRLGNLLLGERGLVAVLDWELAHIGHAGEDLGYLCANAWRFGGERPVGGIGDYQQLLDGYASAGAPAPAMAELRLWELYAALGWGLVCLTMLEMYRRGVDRSLERAAVGRRLSESEIDILLLLEDLGA